MKHAIFCLALVTANTGLAAQTKQLVWQDSPGMSVSQCGATSSTSELDFAKRVAKIHGEPAGDQAIQYYLFAHQERAQLRWEATSRSLYLDGLLDKQAVAALAAALEQQAAPRRLVVNSFGGDALTAMSIANLLVKYQVMLTVRGFCMSACANYLLPAASEVQLDNAVIGLHGSPAACNAKLSIWTGIRQWGLLNYLEFRKVAKRDVAFASNYARLAGLITLSQQLDRGAKDGLAREWLVVSPARVKQLGIRVTSIKSTQTFDLIARDPADSLIGNIHIF